MVRLERHSRYVAQVAALVLMAVGASAADRFAYDATAPLATETKAFRERNGIRIETIAFASPRGGRATGWLVTPPGSGKFAGLIFSHSQGPLAFYRTPCCWPARERFRCCWICPRRLRR